MSINHFRAARQIWQLFPLRGNSKEPRDKGWRTKAYSARDITEHSGNRGLRLTDRQLVIDVDPRAGGTEGFERLCTDLGIDSTTWPCVKTGGGGLHFYLTLPEGARVRGKLKEYQGIDFKHVGGFVVAAGSTHPETGKKYVLDCGEFGERAALEDALEVPPTLLELIRKRDATPTSNGGEMTPQQLAEVLDVLDPPDYGTNETWLPIAMASHHATSGSGLSVFRDWSLRDPKFADDRELIEERWNSFDPNQLDRIGIGTLRKAVIDAGHVWSFAPADVDDFEFEAIEPIGEDENEKPPTNAKFDDFYAYLPQHQYVYIPTRELWPAATIDSILGRKASVSLDRSRPLHQMTWHPGMEMVIRDHVVLGGALLPIKDSHTFNLYLPPQMTGENGDPNDAGLWIEHVRKLYPNNAEHFFDWFAMRVQHPEVKINHALVLGSPRQGIGKDTLIEPLKHAVGPWNFRDIGAEQVFDPFNAFLRSVVLRVNEARDLGDFDRFKFYDHMKTWLATPPDTLEVQDKHIRRHQVFNCLGVIITTNHLTDGLYLPAEDRRHYVCWTEIEPTAFDETYWQRMWRWYNDGGIDHVIAYLRSRDVSKFDPKAPPPKTEAFWSIVHASHSTTDTELADVIEDMIEAIIINGNDPFLEVDAVTIEQIAEHAVLNSDKFDEMADWLNHPGSRRQIPHRMNKCGFVPVRNSGDKSDGRWKINGKRYTIYARSQLTETKRQTAAERLAKEIRTTKRRMHSGP